MPIAVRITQFHPHIDIFIGRVVTFSAQSAVSLVQKWRYPVPGDCVWRFVSVFCEQATGYAQVILGNWSVFAPWFCYNWHLVVLLACQVLLGLAHAWICLRVSVGVRGTRIGIFSKLPCIHFWSIQRRPSILITKIW